MLFFSLNSADIQFDIRELIQRFYTAVEVLPTTKKMELINKHEFAKAALDKISKTFVVYIATLEASGITIYPSQTAQIVVLQQDKAPTEISAKYQDYTNVFSPDLAMELLENININEYAIELRDGKQPPYRPIYTLSLIELETLNAYIKTHLKTGFI